MGKPVECLTYNVRKERYPNRSKATYSFAFKLSISMFINSAIIQFIIAIFYLKNFSGGGSNLFSKFRWTNYQSVYIVFYHDYFICSVECH